MKKFLGMALALALVMPSGSASAEVLKNLKVGGAIDLQANSARNVSDFTTRDQNDRIGNTLTRVLVDMGWDLLDDMHANVTLRKNNRAWGTNVRAGQGNGGSEGLINTAANNDVASNLFIDQAYIKVDKFIGQFDAQIGRQYFGEPGDLVIYFGPKNTYGLYNTAIDAFRMDWANDTIGVTGLAAKITGSALHTGAVTENDQDLRGLDVAVKGMPMKLNAFVWNKVVHSANALGSNNGKNDNLWVIGLKTKAEAMGATAALQAAMNMGEDRTSNANQSANYKGYAALADLSYKADIANVGAFTPWLQGGFGSGRSGNEVGINAGKNEGFTAIASDYRPGIINGRFNNSGLQTLETRNGDDVDTVGLNNRVVYAAGLKVTPAAADKLVLGLGFWDYSFQRATLGNNAFYLADTRKHGIKHIGYEYGITADWKHSENVSYGIGYAKFQPGGFIRESNKKATVGDNPVEFAFADLSLKF